MSSNEILNQIRSFKVFAQYHEVVDFTGFQSEKKRKKLFSWNLFKISVFEKYPKNIEQIRFDL